MSFDDFKQSAFTSPLEDPDLEERLNDELPQDREAIMYLSSRVGDALYNQIPIAFDVQSKSLGGNFIKHDAIYRILEIFAKRKGISEEPIVLLGSSNNALDFFKNSLSSYRINAYYNTVYNYQQAVMIWVARSLGIPLNEVPFKYPPIPRKFNIYPFSEINTDLIQEEGYKLKNYFDVNKKTFIISHGGSKPLKRFNHQQLLICNRILKDIYPESNIIILSTDSFDRRVNYGTYVVSDSIELPDLNVELIIDATKSINRNIAAFRAFTDITFISTDSFLAWLGAGSIASHKDKLGLLEEKDMFNLYTIASPKFWQIYGSTNVSSESLIKNLPLNSRKVMGIDDLTYINHYGLSNKSIPQIADRDVLRLMQIVINKLQT